MPNFTVTQLAGAHKTTNGSNGVGPRSNGLRVVHHSEGYLRVQSKSFGSTKSRRCKQIVQTLFGFKGIEKIKVNAALSTCLVRYDGSVVDGGTIVAAIGNGHHNGHHKQPHRSIGPRCSFEFTTIDVTTKQIQYSPIGSLVCNWEILHQIPGRLRVTHPLLHRNTLYCQHIEKLLSNTLGVYRYRSNPASATVLIVYDESTLSVEQLIYSLEMALKEARRKRQKKDKPESHFAMSTASLGLAAVGNFALPALIPVNMVLVYLTAKPSFKRALRSILRERRIGVDILDSIITLTCLFTGEVFAAALNLWALSVGKSILDKTSNKSQKLLSEAFGKQPMWAHILKNGQEIQVPVESLRPGDIVVVNAGEQIPIDGEVVGGEGTVDQHTLTGESAPVEKRLSDSCYASTVMLGGVLHLRVSQSAENTVASKVRKIVAQSANHKVKVQSVGERIADRAVLPTLGLASLGYMTGGPGSALAIVNCDYGTGIRVAAPTALLASLIVSARNGILIKRGQVLEDLSQVNTFLFDKTGTLTDEVPEVRRIICNDGTFGPQNVLFYAAIAETRFAHPIAKAILKKAEHCQIKLPKRDEAKYTVGFGIEVRLKGDVIKVGSQRYMAREHIKVPRLIGTQLEDIRRTGRSAVLVAVNGTLAGAIELESRPRPEAYDVIQGLRTRGVNDIILISGDHETPTKRLADKLGIETYYSEVLPQDKLRILRSFQRQGKRVAMVGDGINDSLALSKADVSISLSGASDIAVDVADVVFMDGDLAKLNHLFDFSKDLRRNVARSFAFIAIPNTICIVGAMFGMFGLGHSLLFNNGANFLATLNGTLPLGNALNDSET